MTLVLSSQNVFDYLAVQSLCTQEEQDLSQVKLKVAKNFNLLLSLQDGRKLLVKQERHNQEGKTVGEFFNEWRIQEFLQRFPQLGDIRPLLSEVLHFDENHSILVLNYLDNYRDVDDFYSETNSSPTAIATAIGAALATIHRTTLDRQEYKHFFSQSREATFIDQAPNLIRGLERIDPEIFGQVPADGLKFFALYQRYESLGNAIANLNTTFEPCCLTHKDLKLNNVLLHHDWEQILSTSKQSSSAIRLIDWERSGWGDPAFDLGTLITSYLLLWLGSLVVSKSIDIHESLRLAITPLEHVQPSITSLTRAYFDRFPEIQERFPNFLQRVVQFSGLALIYRIQATLQYTKTFGNMGICMLQVAKTLLCHPEQSIPTVFGVAESELTCLNYSLA